MLQFLKTVFTPAEPINFQELVNNGATIVDVRTRNEFQSGHVQNSKNIPLQELAQKLDSLNQHKPVIVCCASGARSSSAQRLLTKSGFENVVNGGGWMQLNAQLNS